MTAGGVGGDIPVGGAPRSRVPVGMGFRDAAAGARLVASDNAMAEQQRAPNLRPDPAVVRQRTSLVNKRINPTQRPVNSIADQNPGDFN